MLDNSAATEITPATISLNQQREELQATLDSMPLNRRHWLVFGFCASGMVFDSIDLQLMSFAAPHLLEEWALPPEQLGIVISAAVVGMMVGTYVFGALADRIGRRTVFQITIGIFSIFTGLAALTVTVGQLALTRLLAGFGIGGSIPVDAIVLSEFMPNRPRGRMMALWAISFSVGGLLAPVLASLILPHFGWRGLFAIGAAPALIIFFVRWMIPETPAFLLMRGRTIEARQAVSWLAGTKVEPRDRFPPPTQAARLNPEGIENRSSVLDLFGPELRGKTVLSWLVWFGWGFSYFGLILWLPTLLGRYHGVPQNDVFMFMIGFAVAGICGRIATLFLVDSWGRRPVIILCSTGGFLAMAMFAQQDAYAMLIVWGCITALFLDGGYSAIVPYIPELYPTRSRGNGVGAAQGVGRIASAIAPIVVGYIVGPAGVSAVVLFLAAGTVVTALAMLFLGKETRGSSMGG